MPKNRKFPNSAPVNLLKYDTIKKRKDLAILCGGIGYSNLRNTNANNLPLNAPSNRLVNIHHHYHQADNQPVVADSFWKRLAEYIYPDDTIVRFVGVVMGLIFIIFCISLACSINKQEPIPKPQIQQDLHKNDNLVQRDVYIIKPEESSNTYRAQNVISADRTKTVRSYEEINYY